MPGPDGIPTYAYKTLGGFAGEIIYDITQALGKENYGSLLSEAYWDININIYIYISATLMEKIRMYL